jgi:hypothetical protein
MAKLTKDELKNRTVADLKVMCDALDIEYSASAKKDSLVKLIMAHQKGSKKDKGSMEKTPVQRAEKLQDAPAWPGVEEITPVEFKTWAREVRAWQRIGTDQGHSHDALYLSLMKGLPKGVKSQVMGELDDDALSLPSVMDLLKRDYGGIEVVSNDRLRKEYRSLRRDTNEGLDAFVKRYRRVRAKVRAAGMIESSVSDVGDLLEACCLDVGQHSAILLALRKEKLETPEERLEFVLGELSALQEMYGLRANTEADQPTALLAETNPGKGPGSWDSWRHKDKGGKKGKWGQKGAWSGKTGGKKGKKDKGGGKGKHGSDQDGGKGSGICFQWRDTGTCKYGDACRFKHEGSVKREAEGGLPPAKRKRKY